MSTPAEVTPFARRLRGPIQKLAFDVLGVCEIGFPGIGQSISYRGTMPDRKQIAELDLKIENLRMVIEALRIGNASPIEMDRALSELARGRAERLRHMRHVSERGRHLARATSMPKYREKP